MVQVHSSDERIETVTGEIEKLSQVEATCRRLMSVPGIGPLISTGIVAAIGTGEAFERGRDFGAWLGLVPDAEGLLRVELSRLDCLAGRSDHAAKSVIRRA